MDGLQVQSRLHDENAGIRPALNNKQGLQQGADSVKSAPLSSRKAFGNITNSAQLQDAAGATAVKPRRALGELSVNRPAQTQATQGSTVVKPDKPTLGQLTSVPQAPSSTWLRQQGAAPAPIAQGPFLTRQQQQQQPQDLAQRYALDGVERYAGRTWQQLEEEREMRQEAEAAASARRLVGHMKSWRLGMLQVPSDDDDELLAQQHMHPRSTQQREAAATCGNGGRSSSPDLLAAMLEGTDDDLFGSCSGNGPATAVRESELPPLYAAIGQEGSMGAMPVHSHNVSSTTTPESGAARACAATSADDMASGRESVDTCCQPSSPYAQPW